MRERRSHRNELRPCARCSTPDELQQFLDGRLDATDGDLSRLISRIARRAATCSSRSPHGPWAATLRRGRARAEAWVDAVLERVKAIGPRPLVMNAWRPAERAINSSCRRSLTDFRTHQSALRRDRRLGHIPELEGFRIIREIGRGGMGVVYEAEEENLSRRVAVKILPAHALEDPRQIRRFEREAKAAGRLHHTNIVPVFGVGESHGTHFYVMQYIDGLGLDLVVDRAAPFAGVGLEREPIRSLGCRRRDCPCSRPNQGETVRARTGPRSPTSPGRWPRDLTRPTHEFARTRRRSTSGCTTRRAPCCLVFVAEEARSSLSSLILPGSSSPSTHSGLGRITSIAWPASALQAAEGLEYAYRQGVLHRDIKPSNLLLDVQGNIWVADFGLATMTDADDLTQSGQVLGTFRYMAPERFRGDVRHPGRRLQPGFDSL